MMFNPIDFTGTTADLDQVVASVIENAGVTPRYRMMPDHKRGAYNEPLYTTYFWIGNRDATTVTVITTGLHGAEGKIGSLFVTDLLTRRSAYEQLLNRDHALLVIVNLSPWSASFGSRFTEDGSDTNRLFGRQPATSETLPPYYAEVDEVLNVPKLTARAALRSICTLLWYRYRHQDGLARMQTIIAEGQVHDPKRLLYVGTGESWTNATVREIIRTELRMAKHVIHVDIHTALGWWGTCLKVVIDHPNSQRYARAAKLFGVRGLISTKVPNRYTRSDKGTIELAFYEELASWQTYTGVCVEIGTLPLNIVVMAMWLRVCVLNTLKSDPEFYDRNDPWSRELVRHAFAPRNKQWRRNALAHLHTLLRNIIRGVNDGVLAQ